MIYYTELIENNKKDTVKFGPILDNGDPLINTAKDLLKELGEAVLPGSSFKKQDKPQLLHCLPQNIVELVDATLKLIDPNHVSDNGDEGKFKELLTVIKNLMQKEKCNVYIIESKVRNLFTLTRILNP